MSINVYILGLLACVCLIVTIVRLRVRQRTREKRQARKIASAVRANRI